MPVLNPLERALHQCFTCYEQCLHQNSVMNPPGAVSGTELYVHLNPGIAAQLQRIAPSLNTTDDVHICGGCKQSFPDINLFVEHKHAGCAVSSQNPLSVMGISLDQSALNYISSSRDSSVSNPASQYFRVILNGNNVPLHLQSGPCEQESLQPLLVTPYKKSSAATSDQHDFSVESCSTQNSVIQPPKKVQKSKQVDRTVHTKSLSTDETVPVNSADGSVPINGTDISCHEQGTLLNLGIEENDFSVQEKVTTELESIEIPQNSCEIIIPSDPLDNISDESSKSYKNNPVSRTSKLLCQSGTICTKPNDCQELEREGTIIIHNDSDVVLVEDYQTLSENNINSAPDPSSVYSDRTKKKHACPVVNCKFTTPYPKDLVRHMRKHTGERPFQCESCKRTYSRIDKLRAHQHIHFGEKCHKCQVCDYATVDKGSLKKHMRIHNDERPYKCQICPYRSKRSCHLTVHLRTHTGDHPFVCVYESCMSAFKTSSDLKRHIRMHTGERPYACDICDYRCSIKSNLGVHIRINHSTENLIPCTVCNHVSVSEAAAREHEKIHSGDSQLATSTTQPQKKDITTRKNLGGSTRSHIRKKNSNSKSHKKLKGKDTCKMTGSERTKCSTAVKPYCVKAHKCTLCDAAFVREDSWRSHMRQHQNQGAYLGIVNDSETLASVHSIAANSEKALPLENELEASRSSTVESKQTVVAVSVIESNVEEREVSLTTNGSITDNGVLTESNVLATNESTGTNLQATRDGCNLSFTSDLRDKATKNQHVEVDVSSVLGNDALQTQPVFLYVQNEALVEESTVVEGFHNTQFF
ncbi:zinc finger protein 236-like isoform X1 [Schistocerca nitens]|uniref:zinc finger protein 236-like isoform X1 n=2 Tax=Schistocerca nitens TaxID=7011 RepID=UPI002118698A|nr:zinc finger protein 236-like isoform X1 [Schistocerca nitens]